MIHISKANVVNFFLNSPYQARRYLGDLTRLIVLKGLR